MLLKLFVKKKKNRMCVKLKGYLKRCLSFSCCDIFLGDVWTRAGSSVPLWFPRVGARDGLMRRDVKRKRRPLSKRKYHNSILNNASVLSGGSTLTVDTKEGPQTVVSFTLTQNKWGEVVQLSKCFFLMHLIHYQTKARHSKWACHRRVSFVPLFG